MRWNQELEVIFNLCYNYNGDNMNDKKYWNEVYYKNVSKDKLDFLKDSWMNKYKNIIFNINGKKAVDLGCGLGQDTEWLINNGFDVISCDFSKPALEKMKELYPNTTTMNFDMQDGLPFDDNSIDLIDANLSLHYFTMDKTIEIFNDIYRVLKPGGLLIGRVNSDKNSYVNDNCEKIEECFYYEKDSGRHRRLFNKKQFDILTKNWKVEILKEDETIRVGFKKYTWEFIFRK